MKYVLIITIHADPAMAPGYEEWGGTHTYMKELIDGLGAKKVNCIMVTRKAMPLPDIEQYNEYCTVYRLQNGDAEPMDKTLLQNYHETNLHKIQEIINKHGKPAIIHSVYWNSGRLAMELAQNNNIRFVHSVISNSRGRTFRGAEEPVSKRAEYEQQIYDKAAYILCVSRHERQDIIDFYNIDPHKVIVAGQYIHESFLLPAHDINGFPRLNSNINEHTLNQFGNKYNNAYTINTTDLYWNQKVFTYIGRMSFYKGVDSIIIAWFRLYQKYEDLCPALWMVGGSILEISQVREEVKKQVQNLDLLEKRGKLVWWGYLDVAGLSTILLKSHILIAHSLYEPGGRVIVEAMSEGVPVIATPNGFAKDYIQNWRNGFLVKYADTKNLFLRMEHFIRQPFLSNALGQNARQDAKFIIKQWNFLDNHLMAYDFDSNIETEVRKNIFYDYFKMRNISLFPFYNIPLSEEYIKRIFKKNTGQQVNTLQTEIDDEYTSYIFRAQGPYNTLIFKQAFTRLSISPMFNPFGNKEYVRKAEDHFNIELTTYLRSNSSVLVDYDTIHKLLILKELTPSHNHVDKVFLQQCIQYITLRKNTAVNEELDIFCQIMQASINSYDNIQSLFNSLKQKLPNYYFEVSGVFCEKLGWAITPYLLEYNCNSIPLILMKKLKQISDCFISLSHQDNRENLRCINTDTELKHFMYSDNYIEMIDYEKSTIGCIENEIAGLLFDYILNQQKKIKIRLLDDILKLVPENLSLKKIIVCMAYRFFYNLQIQLVMGLRLYNTEMKCLEHLYSLVQNNSIE